MTVDTQVYVEVVKHDTNEVVNRMGPMSESKATRVERGVEINMDHEEFFVRTVPAK
jgi:hypothetical protein